MGGPGQYVRNGRCSPLGPIRVWHTRRWRGCELSSWLAGLAAMSLQQLLRGPRDMLVELRPLEPDDAANNDLDNNHVLNLTVCALLQRWLLRRRVLEFGLVGPLDLPTLGGDAPADRNGCVQHFFGRRQPLP